MFTYLLAHSKTITILNKQDSKKSDRHRRKNDPDLETTVYEWKYRCQKQNPA